jgi:hypothetical protein
MFSIIQRNGIYCVTNAGGAVLFRALTPQAAQAWIAAR